MNILLNSFYILFLLFCSLETLAAPPLDLTDPTGDLAKRPAREKALSEEDITFTDSSDHSGNAAKLPKNVFPILYDVTARNIPSREGIKVQDTTKGEFVRVIARSRDHRWIAIELLRGKRVEAWVPYSALYRKPLPKTTPHSKK